MQGNVIEYRELLKAKKHLLQMKLDHPREFGIDSKTIDRGFVGKTREDIESLLNNPQVGKRAFLWLLATNSSKVAEDAVRLVAQYPRLLDAMMEIPGTLQGTLVVQRIIAAPSMAVRKGIFYPKLFARMICTDWRGFTDDQMLSLCSKILNLIEDYGEDYFENVFEPDVRSLDSNLCV